MDHCRCPAPCETQPFLDLPDLCIFFKVLSEIASTAKEKLKDGAKYHLKIHNLNSPRMRELSTLFNSVMNSVEKCFPASLAVVKGE